jgi:hypothetical protein
MRSLAAYGATKMTESVYYCTRCRSSSDAVDLLAAALPLPKPVE